MTTLANAVTALTTKQFELHHLAERFRRYRSFAEELRRATKGKPFDIRNQLVWQSMFAEHRMLIIDL